MVERKLRVLHIITRLELGGAQQNTIYTVRNLDKNRFDVCLAAGVGGILDKEINEDPEIDFHPLKNLKHSISPLHEVSGYFELRNLIRRLEPDIVHTHSSKAGVLGRLAAKSGNVPVIIHSIHGFGIEVGSGSLMQKVLIAAEKIAANATSHFISVSQKNIEEGKQMGLFTDQQVSKIYSGIKLSEFREKSYDPTVKSELGIPEEASVVGCISCFKSQKNPHAFVELCHLISEQRPDVYYILVGDGELRNEIEQLILSRRLQNNLILTGWRTDIARLLKAFDVSVLTSRWEGLPRVIPESLSAGVPVVVTRAGGSAEAVIENVTGHVVEQGEIEKQADLILNLLNKPEKRLQMSNQGPDSVLDWDIDQMVRLQEKLYLKLLER